MNKTMYDEQVYVQVEIGFFLCFCLGERGVNKEFERGIMSLFDRCVNAIWRWPYSVTYGGELLYLWIWRDHSAWSAHIIIIVWFATQ